MDPKEAALEIWRERFPDAKALFLAGSVVRGEGTATSDLDLVVVFERVTRAARESFIHKNWPVEAFIHDPETLNYFFLETDRKSGIPTLPSMVLEGVEIPNPTVFSASIKGLAKSVLELGPPKLEAADLERLRYVITDLVDDIRAPRSTAELRASVIRLYPVLTDFYLRSKNLWSASGKMIPRRLKNVDPVFYERFEVAFDAALKESEAGLLVDLVREVLAPFGGFLFDGFRSDAPAERRRDIDRARMG